MKVRRIAPKNEGKKLKVAAYCRVSTDKSNQEESLETQQRTYETMIRCNPSWEYAGIYVDEGRSGVTDKRKGFQQMIADAKAGKIDKILVKSISRFGRDILLCRQYVEELAAHNVSVYFEREGIDSLNPGTLMLLSLSAAIAQDESRSNSENHHWSNRRRTELGIYKIGNNQVLGYDADKDGKPVPNKDAWIVKMIFELYAEGKEIYQIVDALESADAVTLRSEKRITRQQVRYILQNEVYVGDKLLQKRNPKDLHTKQPDPKREKTSRYLSEDHVPIISRELWNAVQTRFNKNGGKCENRKNAHFLAGRLYCAQCGSVFMRKTYKDRQGNLNRAWKCKGREAGLCTVPIWKEDDLISQISQISQTGSEAQIEQGSGNYLIIGKEIQQTA